MAQLECKNLNVGYMKRIVASDINFSVSKGDYLCIVGENGSGKSTLMKTILGLIPAVSGKIIYSDGLIRRQIGYLPQQTDIQRDFPASVFEIVLSGCQANGKFKPFYTKADKQLATENMEKLGILPLKNRCYSRLSGGQQQRVLLARALCATSGLLLLDEPVSGLDPKVTEEMYETVNELNRKNNITVIMISHDIKAALCYATHILHVGHTAFFGTVEEYKESHIGFESSKGGENQ